MLVGTPPHTHACLYLFTLTDQAEAMLGRARACFRWVRAHCPPPRPPPRAGFSGEEEAEDVEGLETMRRGRRDKEG